MRRRSSKDAFVPTAPSILQWLTEQPMTCHYSGEKITPATMQIDHKTPLHRGGTNDLSNLCLASKAMNNAKGSMTEREFRSLQNLISTFPDGGAEVLTRLKRASFAYGR